MYFFQICKKPIFFSKSKSLRVVYDIEVKRHDPKIHMDVCFCSVSGVLRAIVAVFLSASSFKQGVVR
jgi:hypothetical protein